MTKEKRVTMTVFFNDPESPDGPRDFAEAPADPPTQVIEFFAAREQMLEAKNGRIGPIWYRPGAKNISERSGLLYPRFDPMEDWLYSLVSAAALISLLIGILSLPSTPAPRTDHPQPRPISGAESSFITQKPG
jgi:hypothetical protein